MYIMKKDFGYFENLYKSLDEVRRKKFMDILQKSGSKRMGEEISKIQIVGDEIFDQRGIEPNEMLTRTLIKKAYKGAKEEIA